MTDNVYFQPDENVKLKFPCIIYQRVMEDARFADNTPYHRDKRYHVMVVDSDPDSPLPDLVGGLPGSSFVTHYTKDYLNHDVYNVHTQSL